MQVILLERVEKLGQMGDTVSVKNGYARNYLIPYKKAVRASEGNLDLFKARKAQMEADSARQKADAQKLAETMDGTSVILIRQAGESGQLYGSVTSRDIADALVAAGHAVDRRQVLMQMPVKALGLYPFRIMLHPEVAVTVTVNVAKSEDEAAVQAGQ